MSKVDLNALVNGFSGKLGNAVLRRRGSRTYIMQRPQDKERIASEKQKAQTERFRRAAAYAKSRMADPILKAEYEALAKNNEFMTAFTAALKDYLVLPKIDAVNTADYKGNVGDAIITKVNDDFKVIAVTVSITAADNTVIESGPATFDALALHWVYNTTINNAVLAGCKIKATATDRPGNEVSIEKVL